MRILGTFRDDTGESITIGYSSPNYYVELAKPPSMTPARIGACRPTATGIEVFAPSSSPYLGTLIVPGSTFDDVTVQWKRLGPVLSTKTYRRTK